MKRIVVLLLILSSTAASAQYYFNDILHTGETNGLLSAYRKNGIRQINVKSFERDGSASEGFEIATEFSNNYQTVTTTTNTALQGSSKVVSSYNSKGLLVKTIGIENDAENTTTYSYDSSNNLLEVLATSNEVGDSNYTTERHLYQYNKGKLVQMLKIKNNTDTTFVVFRLDDKGKVVKETWLKGQRQLRVIENYFYYYNANNELTDVVQPSGRQLLPVISREYDGRGQLVQMVNTRAGGNGYLLWRYSYNENGLKKNEKCYSKKSIAIGEMVYEYK
jgi:YD repeat-containing protein